MNDYIDIQEAKQAISELKELCKDIIDVSIFWTGEDEEKFPLLKRIRTLSGFYLEKYK